MPTKDPHQSRVELLQGTLDMLILRTLQWGAQHGHGVGQAIRETTDLYKSSAALCIRRCIAWKLGGLISSEWQPSELNRRAKYYRLTAAGKKHLFFVEQSKWKLLVRTITRVMRPE